jgi:hypothetical protein
VQSVCVCTVVGAVRLRLKQVQVTWIHRLYFSSLVTSTFRVISTVLDMQELYSVPCVLSEYISIKVNISVKNEIVSEFCCLYTVFGNHR